ncbi:putative membrane protein [Breznakia sp. PF5-3]|uniref:SdpI family protein n=1 Tax=unclassified Breznakia TaxID=2623764 RepID=UPI002407179D|nr:MULTISPECIES: SdpI family protein [unclassified Breznakia]MDL2276235.1 SdpI family protein [Breznakia sp. OttesenSCG-928-G09]MDF9824893.1 putative membrane protein [Breznakia sp. PM6-1]MDF9835608.1 putative membrane protein [Breznakia sp. PF5-3]MDF9837976.1 putative membrane protein [Breznakia sp. PFB2-8]MDF9859965.1 putative membrane protein [Breznakia sp. PH5-24]
MEIRNKLTNTLIVISLLGLLVIIFMPTSFPMQYSFSGEISRWGNRFEFLGYWMIPVFCGFITKCYIAYQRNKYKISPDEHLRNEKPLLTFAIIFMTIFDSILIFVVTQGFILLSTKATVSTFPFINVAIGLAGILIIVVGNYFPVLDYNSMIGFKNTWSIANEKSWELTHRWIGRVFLIFGFSLILYAVLSQANTFNTIIFFILVGSCVIVSYIISYIAYQKTK